MINAEKYRNEIIEALKISKFAVNKKTKEIKACEVLPSCKLCLFYEENSCNQAKEKWMLAECQEPIKLSKREKAFLEYAETGYIAREENGGLCCFSRSPKRKDGYWAKDYISSYIFEEELFKFIQWEDEPVSVEELLENGVVE